MLNTVACRPSTFSIYSAWLSRHVILDALKIACRWTRPIRRSSSITPEVQAISTEVFGRWMPRLGAIVNPVCGPESGCELNRNSVFCNSTFLTPISICCVKSVSAVSHPSTPPNPQSTCSHPTRRPSNHSRSPRLFTRGITVVQPLLSIKHALAAKTTSAIVTIRPRQKRKDLYSPLGPCFASRYPQPVLHSKVIPAPPAQR